MSHDDSSLRKSQFTGQTTVADTSTFDFVLNNQNFKITKADLIAALGFTGTIEQEGPLLGTPVLDIDGTVNKIRNLTGGTGVTISIDAENGIQIDIASNEITEQITEVNATYTALVTDDTIIADGTFTITLPPVATAYKSLTLKSKFGGGVITVDGDGIETIEGITIQVLTASESIRITPTSTGWDIVA